jgi:aldose sugar dehydrogenase
LKHYYSKIVKSSVLLLLALLLANSGTYLQIISKQAYAATSAIFLNSNSNMATIAKVQLPGILTNNNENENNDNNNNPSTPTPTSPPTNPSANNNNQGPATTTTTTVPSIVHRNTRARAAIAGPTLNDPNLKVEQVINTGLRSTTSMAFLGPNDILVLEKDAGIVHRILNGKMLPEPLLDVSVANVAERGLLGIAIAKNDNGGTESGNVRHVFLYYTESGGGKDGDDEPSRTATATTPDNSSRTNTGSRGLDTVPPAGNRLYRYDIDESGGNNIKLTNPLLLLNLPATPPPGREGTEKNHNAGKVLIGPDNNVYVGVGDVAGHKGQAENNPNGIPPDGTGGILRITQDGQIANNPPLGDSLPLALYYAYGMRNTFGMDFDPVTGNLWDTENGNTFGDEINLVKPGFNSGWSQVAGIWEAGSKPGPVVGADSNNPPEDLVTFDGKGVYRAPELATLLTIAPTALKFLNSDKLGKQYENTIFMGDVDFGNLYNFKLNQDRTGLVLEGPLSDKVANNIQDLKEGGTVLGQGFGVITDIQVGPDDGYLYILTLNGSIYRIVPNASSS